MQEKRSRDDENENEVYQDIKKKKVYQDILFTVFIFRNDELQIIGVSIPLSSAFNASMICQLESPRAIYNMRTCTHICLVSRFYI